jgi:hypothetical protein
MRGNNKPKKKRTIYWSVKMMKNTTINVQIFSVWSSYYNFRENTVLNLGEVVI